MTTPVTICDDSSFARKQLARALPENWDVEVTFAVNGVEGIEAVRENLAEVMFLDLTMPEMDGYEVLEAIKEEQLNSVVIVISGDIQPEARARVMALGAIDFVKKPIDSELMLEILNNFGLVSETLEGSNQSLMDASVAEVSLLQVYQEISNVAMGQAADLLAQHLDAFVVLPVPSVGVIEATELQMMLQSVGDSVHTSAVFQGFIGNGIAGEALLIFDQANFEDIARLLKFEGELNRNVEIELMMDIASILIGAFLKTYFKILDVQFSQSHPKLLARNHIRDLTRPKEIPWTKTLSIEINYGVEDHHLNCDLLILFAEDSIETMDSRVTYYAS
ncbi:MAG: response regulator [Gammaproteobacteria bacterium]|nr:response regulator [Gammaproteobacteria bacterium]